MPSIHLKSVTKLIAGLQHLPYSALVLKLSTLAINILVVLAALEHLDNSYLIGHERMLRATLVSIYIFAGVIHILHMLVYLFDEVWLGKTHQVK